MSLDVPVRGTKRTCQSCAIRFYDLDKPEPACPKCGAAFVPAERPIATRYVRKSRAPFFRGAAKPAVAQDTDGETPIMDKTDGDAEENGEERETAEANEE